MAARRDRITDFSVKDDTIHLNDVVFKKAANGIVYDGKKGYLTFDPDGSGSRDGIHLAALSTGLNPTAGDFLVV